MIEWERQWDEGEGRLNVSALCRQFGISRDSGHRLIARYQAADHDLEVAKDQSKCPHTLPTKVDDTMEDIVVKMRKEHPRWGPKKLRALIVGKHPRLPVPSASTIGAILKRRGLSEPRKRRAPRSTPFTQPFADVVAPNTTWCVDFKGQFRMKDGRVCYPLTIIDAHTRFLIRCEGLLEPTFQEVQRVFDSAFQEFGVPEAIRSDNRPPFATVGPGSLSALSVWWTRLATKAGRFSTLTRSDGGGADAYARSFNRCFRLPKRFSSR